MRSKRYISNNQQNILFPEMELTFADFFCGSGGFSLGFIQAGLKCISAMDMAPDAIATFWYNLCYKGWSHLWINPENTDIKKLKKYCTGETHNKFFQTGIPDNWLSSFVKKPMPCLNLFMYSITDLDPEDWMTMCGIRPGDVSIFIGGPPCQGFSTCNNYRNVLDERNQLPIRFIYYCKVCQPKIVIMENVPGILTLGKKKGEKEGLFPIWLREKFNEAGYSMEYKTVNAADYGVPQRRRRVIFIATRNDCIKKNLFPSQTHGKTPDLLPYIQVRESIGHLPPVEAGNHWGKDQLHAYGYNPIEGCVICPNCLHYNLESRLECHECGYDLSEPIRGGVLYMPGLGILVGTKNHIDNDYLKKYHSYNQTDKNINKKI